MAKYKITVPEGAEEFTGVGAGDLAFIHGVAETESEWLAAWHESTGYKVEVVEEKQTKGK